MSRYVGTVSRGIRCPIIKEGDDLASIVVESVLNATKTDNFALNDKDVIAVTESVVARSQGNYCTVDDIATDVKNKFGEGSTVGVIFPILSRNRFSIMLKGIARGVKKVVLMLSYPSDEVGNALLTYDDLDEKNVNPYSDVVSLEKYRSLFGKKVHEFTGVDYIDFYKQLIEGEGAECEIIFANQAKTILDYTNKVLACDIHTRARTKRILREKGAYVLGLDDILNESVNGSGFNSKYGLLGSNKSTEEKNAAYEDAKQNEERINNSGMKFMSKLTETLMNNINQEAVDNRRQINFTQLHNMLKDINRLNPVVENGAPMVYPLLVNCDTLRQHLIENRVYVSTWWRWILESEQTNEFEKKLSKYLIPLPINQYYTVGDMMQIARIVKEGL